MSGVTSRSTVFSGCAFERFAVPARQATFALARALDIELWEAPSAGCCGARADLRVDESAVRGLVAPLYGAARQGLDITCLSPACRRVVAAHAPVTPSSEPAESAPRVRDLVQLLVEPRVLERLVDAVRMPLYPLRVAFHGACHQDHDTARHEQEPPAAAGWREHAGRATHRGDSWMEAAPHQSLSPDRAVAAIGAHVEGETGDPHASDQSPMPNDMSPAGPNTPGATSTADPSMLQLVNATGAVPLHDVSIVGRCADTRLVPVLAGAGAGSTAPHCLTLTAGAGADMLVTPCFLCFAYLNELQGRLERGDDARRVPVLYLSQLLGLACGVAPGHLELERLAVPSRRALARFII